MSPSGEVTALLQRISSGDRSAEPELMQTVYRELKRIAASFLKSERADHTLQPTALVHEAYIRLISSKEVSWQDRGHFFSVASRIMRRLLVDHARQRLACKRGGGQNVTPLDEMHLVSTEPPEILIDLDEALDQLAVEKPQLANIVELRFFGGLTEEEIAGVLGISSRTVKRHWLLARAWLFGQLQPKQVSP